LQKQIGRQKRRFTVSHDDTNKLFESGEKTTRVMPSEGAPDKIFSAPALAITIIGFFFSKKKKCNSIRLQ
jgi:hypothetical protein